MSKFESKSDLKKSLFDNITLMHNDETGKSEWAEFHEIESLLKDGFYIFNDQKRELYNKLQSRR